MCVYVSSPVYIYTDIYRRYPKMCSHLSDKRQRSIMHKSRVWEPFYPGLEPDSCKFYNIRQRIWSFCISSFLFITNKSSTPIERSNGFNKWTTEKRLEAGLVHHECAVKLWSWLLPPASPQVRFPQSSSMLCIHWSGHFSQYIFIDF